MLELETRPRIELTLAGHNYGRFTIEPLERGYGTTLGHALRRILLRSLPGAAIVRARMRGKRDIWHEFATIDGVREDVTEIVLNLKRIRIHANTPVKEARAYLSWQGSGPITAGDIEWPSELDVVNPELVIANADGGDTVVDMEITVSIGRGYLPAEAQQGFHQIGDIPIDAIFTPIEKVNYVVEQTRVGGQTDFDRLIFEIQTDGTIEPEAALTDAADILVQHAQLIAGFKGSGAAAELETPQLPKEVEAKPLSELGLSPRVLNALRSRQIDTVGQALAMERDQLLSIRNFGPRSLRELFDALEANGYLVDSPLVLGDDTLDDQPELDEAELEESAADGD